MSRFALAAALLAATALPAAAFDPAAMTETEKAAFGEAVRDYIMTNPEVLIEAVNSLEAKRLANEVENDRALVAANSAAIFEDGYSWVGGNPQGDLTLVEFVDYRCGVCRRVHEDVGKVVAGDGNIRLIYKEFPILGQESDLASRFAIAVKQTAGDDVYKNIHDRLMTMRGAVTVESLSALARDMDLEAEPLVNRMNTEEVSAEIRANAQLAERMGVMGTPTFIIGGEMLRGVPQTGLADAVEQIRALEG
ncbi:DsbA family protein [Paracoccus sp. Z118]|uniref:DsbA family protein n=1 Tax=Paracoccus sp. Z118 TaxID=2851017 RepID=UPI0020B8AC11|nr:DsbA family protein [Paracoccus sp. Z118]